MPIASLFRNRTFSERTLDVRLYQRWKNMRRALRQTRPQAAPAHTIFVAGTPRSGTNMMMYFLERSAQTQVLHETDPRAYIRFRLRDATVIEEIRDRCRSDALVIKCLMEGHRMRQLVDRFAPAMGVWMFRHFDDMIRSHMKSFPGNREYLEQILDDRASGKFRGRGMTDATLAVLKSAWRPALNHPSAIALFWYYRSQLVFDQNLDEDDRILLIDYNRLCREPEAMASHIAGRLGLSYRPYMSGFISQQSVGKPPIEEIEPHIRALCDEMYARLTAASEVPTQASAAASG